MAKIFAKSWLQGGQGGSEWDDDAYEGIKKVYIGQDSSRISYVKFEYVKKDGQVVTQEHGKIEQQPKEFVVEYPNEFIISVKGIYNIVFPSPTEVITSLVFKTSKGRSSPSFDQSLLQTMIGTKFVLGDGKKKIVGFHGRSGNAIDALGVYFAHPVTPAKKLEAVGGNGGVLWDDGAYDNVKTIHVGQCNDGVSFVKFEYIKGAEIVYGDDHGKKSLLGAEKFELEESEYLTGIEGFYDKVYGIEKPLIICLKFKTNKKESTPYGMESGEKFFAGENGYKIVGFHGRAGDVVHSVGVIIAPITTA